MAKVFVPQQPSRYDRDRQLWVPTVNLQAAERYGEIIIMLPPNVNRMHTAPLVDVIRRSMADFTSEDYVVALGDPSLIAAAACIANRMTGGNLKILKWDKMTSDYVPVELFLA